MLVEIDLILRTGGAYGFELGIEAIAGLLRAVVAGDPGLVGAAIERLDKRLALEPSLERGHQPLHRQGQHTKPALELRPRRSKQRFRRLSPFQAERSGDRAKQASRVRACRGRRLILRERPRQLS